jgi:signal transduction histidine kinase
MMVSSIIPNIIWRLFGEGQPRPGDINPIWILLAAFLTVFVTVTLYSIIINKVIVKRIKTLSDTTQKVINGDYNVTIKDPHKDELSQLSHSFNEMTQALKQNEYVSKNFIRNFSHEYKTPLSTIKGYAELIQDEDNLSNDTREYLDIIIDESNRLSNLSYNMLLISQIDHQIILPKEDHINITEELRKVIQMKQLLFEEKDLSFDLDVQDIKIKTNQSLIYQVFSNIIDNAIKYTYPGQTIGITFTKKENQLIMNFSNPTKHTDVDESQLFNMFYTNQTHTMKSSGIGLSLVKKIIEKLDGSIQASIDNQIFNLQINIPI